MRFQFTFVSYKIAATDEVVNYSLFAASKLLQKKGDWEKISELFSGFIEDKPDNPTVISALYWIGKAKAHEGKPDEAKKIAAETIIKKYIGQPDREALELLLTQLAQLCLKKKKPMDAAVSPAPPSVGEAVSVPNAVTSSASPAPSGSVGRDFVEPSQAAGSPSPLPMAVAETSPTVPPVPEDPGAELDALLSDTGGEQNNTAKARILYAKAELARLRKQPAEEEKNIAQIAGF